MTKTLLWADCETVGLCGGVKLIQFSIDDSPVQMIPLYIGWERDALTRERLNQFFSILDSPNTMLIGFNVGYDCYHLLRILHRMMGYEYNSRERPVMPFKCKVLDLQIPAMLKSPLAPFAFSRGNGRSVALLRRIPVEAQEYVAGLVTSKLKPLLPQSLDLNVSIHKVPKQPKLVTLGFNVKGRVSLKGLMREYGLPTLDLTECWPLPNKEDEKPWLPYPDPKVHDPIEFQCDEVLRGPKDSAFYRYSQLDILYLKVLYEKLGRPEPDYNSSCASAMAYLRYYGFDVDRDALNQAEEHYGGRVEAIEKKISGVNLRSSTERLALLRPHFPFMASTSKKVLTALANDDTEGGRLCRDIVEYGPARQRLLQVQKVKECKTRKAHPDLRVMGTPTNRMAGTGGLNWQGIGAVEEILEEQTDEDISEDGLEEDLVEQAAAAEEKKIKIGLRKAILTPCVGDWRNFEIFIAAEVYGDKQLQEDLRNNIDIHSMASVTSNPEVKKLGMSYQEFHQLYKSHDDWATVIRKKMKMVVFGTFYFASAMKIAESLSIPDHEGQEVLDRFYGRYEAIGRYRRDIENRFITADTDRWSRHCIETMQDSVTDLTGFERHWNFEKGVAIALWELGQGKSIRTGLTGSVIRTQAKGPQSYDMAITSACLGSAIAIQAAVSRQAGNMKIQATGSSLTKMLMAEAWDKQRVATLPIHDELVPTHHPYFNYDRYTALLDDYVNRVQSIVPMLKFDYAPTTRWSDK